MKIGENAMFLGVLSLVILAGAGFYAGERLRESGDEKKDQYDTPAKAAPSDAPAQSGTPQTIVQTSSAAATTSLLMSLESTTTAMPTTSAAPRATKATSSTSPTTTTLSPKPSYLDRYSGKGYSQAFIDIQYFCPSCVPAVAQNVQHEPGVKGKSMSYQQKVSWVIYDPKVVDVERILELAASSGGATLINDTLIP